MSPFRLKALHFVSAILATLVAAGPVFPYEASRGPTEVVYWDPDRAYNGYTVVSPSRVDGVYLLDMAGEVVITTICASTMPRSANTRGCS